MGSAAGGGFPQWNCSCRNCRAVRDGSLQGKARTQLQLAISGNGETWFLLNASPDLRWQIEATPALHPRHTPRHTPIAGVLLTGAELDQVLGLLLLREFQQFRIYATSSIRRILREDNTVFAMLNRVPDQAQWTDIVPQRKFPMLTCAGGDSRLECLPVSLAARYPNYVSLERCEELSPQEGSLGFIIGEDVGRRLAYCPVVSKLDGALLQLLESVDLVLFDGTFWSDDELTQLRAGAPSVQTTGHIPISGPHGSLQALARVTRPRKIYIHVNNTNPILDESGPEYRRVREAGWEVAEDGWQFEL